MRQFSDSMKEDSDRVYKYSLINLLIAFLPPDILKSIGFSGITFSESGLIVLQTVTAVIVMIQTVSFLVNFLSNKLEIVSSSSKILTEAEKEGATVIKNVHTGKNYYERAYMFIEGLRTTIFFFQVVTPISVCVLCIFFTFL